jgi:hypothetical protein
MTSPSHPDPQAIRELAYYLWELDGRRDGPPDIYWFQAERQLSEAYPPMKAATSRAVDDSIKESFPASDPPASRIPDVPPVNAEAKWEAEAKAKGKGVKAAAPAATREIRTPRSPAQTRPDPKRPPH